MMTNFKKDFPIFAAHPELVFLDNASTTQKPQRVIDAVSQFVSHDYANIHRGSYDLAVRSEELYHRSKVHVGKLINCSPDEVIYSYNATASANLLAQSLCLSGILGE
jgi:selenocysteine lyase/cysteine desulfurase